jgi:hypothetical protein
MEVTSGPEQLHVRFERTIRENGATVRRRVWTDSLPRTWH